MVTREYRESGHITRLGWFVVCMALISFLVVLWGTYQDRRDTACQKDVNEAFYSFSKDRAALADDDRAAFRTLVDKIEVANTQELLDAAFAEYNATADALDVRRDKLEAPTPESICTK